MASTKPRNTKSAKTSSAKVVKGKVTSRAKTTSRLNQETSIMSQRARKANSFTSAKKEEAPKQGMITPKVRRLIVIGALLLLVAGLVYYYRSLFVVATVNGQPVSRLAYIQEMERESGRQAMNTLVTKTLILQEASKQKVGVSEKEIDDEIKKIEDNLSKQGQKLDQVLGIQGINKEGLEEQIKYQKLIEKMVGKNITVTDKEVTDYIDKNKDTFPEGTNPAELKTSVTDQLKRQKLNDKIQAWLDNLQKNAKVNYLVNS